MAGRFVTFENVSYIYDAMSLPLLEKLSASFPAGWTGIAGANGTGKTTVLKLATGLLNPETGQVRLPGDALYCAQRTDEAPALFERFIYAADRAACEWKGRLAIGADWVRRWDSLSHGERKRAQIGVMLWRQPAVLALDEPTNHIDMDARSILIAALRRFAGIGLLVSHDRELLDSLCNQCLFLDPPRAVMRPGNYSLGRIQAAKEEDSARRRKELAKRDLARLQAENYRRAAKARGADRKRSKGALDRGDRDGRARIDLARLSGKDGRAGRLARQVRSRLDVAHRTEQSILVRKTYEQGIWMSGEFCRRDTLFRLSAGILTLGDGRELRYPDLTMSPRDRIGLTGANGSGKSTLVRAILARIDLPPERLTYLPQEIDTQSSRAILEEARRLPPEVLGRLMTAVSRLGSRPARLLESDEPSPGEVRKLLLGFGIARRPYLIIMDEPTNHLDLPSIECLEDALDGCPCGLLLVSHDLPFLSRLTRIRWHITPADCGLCITSEPFCAPST
jgi:ATPase subunit of ABC transporter with duplicated ATPase domains